MLESRFAMRKQDRQSIAAIPLILLLGGAVVWAGSRGGLTAGGVPLFALCGALAFVINWIAFVPAYLFRTERYYDLTGSITYLSLVVVALTLQPEPDARALILGGLVVIWAARLGGFLFMRILRDGSDRRFAEIKTSLPRFFTAWTLQGLWVLMTLACALAAMLSASPRPLGAFALVGGMIWLAGFAIEAVADLQKSRFRSDAGNRGRFIRSGLWAWSRHPNYFGEITLWVGIALICLPVLSGWQLVTLISPVFVYVLLTRVSGIPLLEARAEKTWGNDSDFLAYRERTPVLFPRPPKYR